MRTQFFVTDGPLATTMSECSESYFREHLAAGTGGVRVVRRGGVTDLIAGSRYLDAGTAIRPEVCGGALQVIYLGCGRRRIRRLDRLRHPHRGGLPPWRLMPLGGGD
ncbi:hypothetical protein MGALJ_60780 (plasmid) [Mycobacterium gallinarum]|uniref:Uncharacterized protein n=1 Tax=Mycobacterium gallinarum TaxID=39689 RepID=A0A9W4B9K3_9MYCO|nr:hypothetical protein [Mycobacterium gallinarum]BBY96409.1 hypothetical protein MGALJ_60780 [Mycobacterium gallinarum]